MRKSVAALIPALVLSLGLAACAAAPQATSTPVSPATNEPTVVAGEAPTGLSGEINIAGSTTVQPLAEKFAEVFMAANPDVRVAVQGGGSSTGVKSAGEGTVDIGTASREVKDEEKTEFPNLKIIEIARDGIAIVGNSDVPVDDLTKDQVRDIFAGTVTNWNQVGGPDGEIIVVAREEGSGTRAAFEEMVMGKDAVIVANAILQPSNGAVRSTVTGTPGSIAFLSFGYLDDSVKILAVDGVQPSAETAADGSYPIVRPLNMLTNGEPNPLTKAFLDFILGSEGQAIVEAEGYLPVQ